MKRCLTLVAILSLAFVILHFAHFIPKAFSEGDCDPSSCPTDDQDKRLTCLSSQISSCTAQLQDAQKQEKTLKSQLALIDGQTQVTILKIEETNLKINKLKREINNLSFRIDRIGATLDTLSEILLQRIVQTYKYNNTVSAIDLLFSSHGFADLLERLKYIQVAQAYDKKKLYELQATKLAYNDQKQDKQTRQAEAEKLNEDLENYKTQLAEQKKAKDELLKITQNNEILYQQKILAAQQEQQAILVILNGGGKETPDGQVGKGDIIGHYIIGPSPCSSGTHLHFEVRQNNSIQDPQDPNYYLSSVSFQYYDNDGGKNEGLISPHGSWDWPISQPIEITQGYGMTPFATGAFDGIKHYNGGPHTGIDMWTPPGLTAVKAVHDGTKYTGELVGICNGGPLRYKKVDHGDGISSYYLHVL